jgi:hypothetical protein
MVMLDENDMIAMSSPPPAERAPMNHSRNVDPYLNRAQSSRVGTVTYVPPRSSQLAPVSSTPVLPSDFLRYDETTQYDVDDTANSSSRYRDR